MGGVLTAIKRSTLQVFGLLPADAMHFSSVFCPRTAGTTDIDMKSGIKMMGKTNSNPSSPGMQPNFGK